MKILMLFVALLILALPVLVMAQDEAETPKELTLLERARQAAVLIQASQEAREAGIPEEEVKDVLEGARDRGMTPKETEEVLTESTAAVEESGPVDNYGAFVQARLDEGLRGKELAAAIHQEHKLHGKGKGYGKGQAKHEMKKEKKEKQKKHGEANGDRDDDNDDHDDDDQDEQDGKGKGGAKKKGK